MKIIKEHREIDLTIEFDRNCTAEFIEGTKMWLERSEETFQCDGCSEDTRVQLRVALSGTQHRILCLDCVRAAAAMVMDFEEGKLKI